MLVERKKKVELNVGNYGYLYEESLKVLRTNLQFSGNDLRVIMLTSAVPGEGKSDTSFNLAHSLTQIGKRVLYLDADIRRTVFIAKHAVSSKVDGLSQYLSGQKGLDDIVYESNIPNLDIIFAGPYAPNPAELLAEAEFSILVEKARREYDYIIIDTPPLSNIVDAAVVGRCTDGAVIVIKSGEVSYKLVKKVKEQLLKVNCKILGTVLNKVEVHKNNYHYSRALAKTKKK